MWHSLPKFNQTVSNFINKTYQILNNHQHESIVSWSPHGNSFIIKDIKSFQGSILPLYFKHSNFSSFVRQLNMYSFHKVRGDSQDCQFLHDKFKKGHPELLNNIKRKQSEGLIQSQNGIGEIIIHSQVLDKKEQIGRNSKPLSEQYLKDNPQKIPSRDLIFQHDALQKQNRQLKIIKQMKSLSLKTLTISNGAMMSEKFFKLITSLYAQKIKKYIGIKIQEQNHMKIQKGGSFEQIIDHVMGVDQPLTFKQYGKTANTIEQKRTDYQFIMSKAIGNSQE